MTLTGLRLWLASLVLLGFASVGFAQVAEVKGTVQRVDVPTRTIHLTDGRIVRLVPGTRLYVGNREVGLADIEPGWILATSGTTFAPGSIVVHPAAPPRTLTAAASAVDATGIVAHVDARTGTITLQDGRMVRVTPGTTVWQPATVGSIQPGASVFVRNAEPLAFRPGTAPATSRPFHMGTVANVDPSTSRIVLSDGRIVQLPPGTQATFSDGSLTIAELRAGDEIIVGLPAGNSVVVTGSEASALPRQAFGVIEATSIHVVRRTQAP